MAISDLLIFDCDGVLVDSETISVAVLLDTLGEAGVALTEDVAYARFLGRSMASIVEILEADYGLAITGSHLEGIRNRLYERFRRDLKATRGVCHALDLIANPRCVASSSQPDRIRLSLALAGLLDCFEPNIYSSSMVKHGKPSPDLFLHAARSMGVPPAGAIVIEDSPAGVEAAQRAGMRVFAYAGGSHVLPGKVRPALEALRPDVVFDDMVDLPALVARESGRPGVP